MIAPIEGRFGPLICVPWTTTAPTGQDASHLLLAAPDDHAPATMPLVAEALRLDPRPSGFTSHLAGAGVRIGADDWVFLQASGQLVACRPTSAEWARTARTDRRVVLTVGFEPMHAGMDVHTYAERTLRSAQMTVGLVPLE